MFGNWSVPEEFPTSSPCKGSDADDFNKFEGEEDGDEKNDVVWGDGHKYKSPSSKDQYATLKIEVVVAASIE